MKRFDVLDAVLLAMSPFALAVFLVARSLLIPEFAAMFEDFGGTLPVSSRLSLSAILPVGTSLVVAALVLTGVALRLLRGGNLGRVVLAVAIATPVVAGVVCVLGLYMPIFELSGAIQAE